MLHNYLTIAFRALWKNKGITAINVVGLSVGLACFALFLLHIVDEFSFDRFHAKAGHIFRIYQDNQAVGDHAAQKDAYLPMPLGPALQADLPDVVRFTRYQGWRESFVRTSRGVHLTKVDFVDAAFFQLFSFPWAYGDAATALSDPNQVVLTEATAQKLFGEANPVGKTLEIKLEEQFEPFVVTGVMKNLPSNSTAQFQILASFEKFASTSRGQRSKDRWNHISMQTFVELQPGSDLPQDSARLLQFWQKYYPDTEKKLREKGQWTQASSPSTYGLQPLLAMHHATETDGVNPKYAWILLAIGGVILLIACINFTTLTIGRSAGRAREIGVRKCIGASRQQLSRQFLTEALLLSAFSTGIGMLLAWGLLPTFNQLIGKELSFNFQQFPELWWLVPTLTLVVGALAGSYPAFVLSGFSPLDTLKSKLKVGGENWFTRSLVTLQFVLSVGLMACTFIMLRQLEFLQSKSPGFDRENVVIINAEGTTNPTQVLTRFREAVRGQPDVLAVSGAELSLGEDAGWSRSGFDYQGQEKNLYEYHVDPEYLSVLGMQLLAGRNFDRSITSDSVTAIIINESAVRDFGWTNESALGQPLTGYDEKNPARNPVVIGVVRDFHFRSFHEQVKPMMFQMFHDYKPQQFFVRIASGDPAPTLERLRTAWASAEAVLPFRYQFLDENLRKFYQTETRWGKTVGLAGSIAILLACLGLFGLAALSTMNRTKEIGIRKVLGASVSSITGLLATDFLKLVFVAILIASPIAWYYMQRWLADFAYHIDIQWWMFAGAGLAAIVIAFLTVSFQSVRAALANPVKSLRSE
ncbi:MAG: ABC transporter permease [Saprospiraceae bacterium]|nr:ABC transporter permease [Saprospiraceae bacterium]